MFAQCLQAQLHNVKLRVEETLRVTHGKRTQVAVLDGFQHATAFRGISLSAVSIVWCNVSVQAVVGRSFSRLDALIKSNVLNIIVSL